MKKTANVLMMTAAAFIVAVFASCSSPQYASSPDYYADSRSYAGLPDEAPVIIYNASMTLKVKRVDSAVAQLGAIAKRYDGYLVNSSSHHTVIRVKSEKIKEAMTDAGKLGKLTRSNIYSEDVTDQYRDLNIRLDNAEKARKRYLELLQKAQNVEEALKVEKELERLNTEIDLLKGKVNQIEHNRKFATLTVTHERKKILGPLGYVSVYSWKLVKLLFVIR